MKELVPRRSLQTILLAIVALALLPAGAMAARLTPAQRSYLGTATSGVGKAHLWWDNRRHWYRDRLYDHDHYPLATIWSAYPLFEALDAIAIAQPTRTHRGAVRRFATGAERYWNPHLRPHPGYAPYPGDRSPHERVWFDDNGWWGIGFYDAYRATHNGRFLADAKRALVFIDRSGWARGGGIWWNTGHGHKAGESLASATYLAASLYRTTGDAYYLGLAQKFIAWGDAEFAHDDGLYDRREDDETPMPYVQGPMFAAFASLCQSTGDTTWCDRAEALAERSARRFAVLDMGPQYDAIYLRSLLELYRMDHDPRWYSIVEQNAARALSKAGDGRGLFLRSWDGSSMAALGTRPNMLQTHAATASVLAWIATVAPPSGG